HQAVRYEEKAQDASRPNAQDPCRIALESHEHEAGERGAVSCTYFDPSPRIACCWATAAANHIQIHAPSVLQMTCAERGSTHGLASYRLSRVMACTTPRSFGATLARGVLTCGIVVGSALLVSFAGNHWHVGAWLAPPALE